MAKLAIPANEKDLASPINERFARAPYFLIYDVEKDEHEWEENDLVMAHGVGPKIVQHFINKGISIFIVPQVGENARLTIKSGGGTVYQAGGASLKEIIENFKSGILKKIV